MAKPNPPLSYRQGGNGLWYRQDFVGPIPPQIKTIRAPVVGSGPNTAGYPIYPQKYPKNFIGPIPPQRFTVQAHVVGSGPNAAGYPIYRQMYRKDFVGPLPPRRK